MSGFPTGASPVPGLRRDPEWFKTAVFYELLARAFSDTTGSGTGDFQGVISKLDYIQWLGVDCIWLPPFYASPLRDGGYDIADYTAVLPEFGTIEDFRQRRQFPDQIAVYNRPTDVHPTNTSKAEYERFLQDFHGKDNLGHGGSVGRCG